MFCFLSLLFITSLYSFDNELIKIEFPVQFKEYEKATCAPQCQWKSEKMYLDTCVKESLSLEPFKDRLNNADKYTIGVTQTKMGDNQFCYVFDGELLNSWLIGGWNPSIFEDVIESDTPFKNPLSSKPIEEVLWFKLNKENRKFVFHKCTKITKTSTQEIDDTFLFQFSMILVGVGYLLITSPI